MKEEEGEGGREGEEVGKEEEVEGEGDREEEEDLEGRR